MDVSSPARALGTPTTLPVARQLPKNYTGKFMAHIKAVDGLKRNMSRGNSLSHELERSSVLVIQELVCISRLGVAIQSRKVIRVRDGAYKSSISASHFNKLRWSSWL